MCGSPVKINFLQFLLYSGTPALRTPALYGQFHLSRQKAHKINNNNILFSLKLTFFIQTPVNTDNRHFSVSRITNSHNIVNPSLRTLVICTLSNYYVIIVDIVPCSNNDRFFVRVNKIVLQY